MKKETEMLSDLPKISQLVECCVSYMDFFILLSILQGNFIGDVDTVDDMNAIINTIGIDVDEVL